MRKHLLGAGRAARVLALLLLTTCSQDTPGPTEFVNPKPGPIRADVTPGNAALLVGAGDIARCDRTNDEATGRLLDNYPSATVFTAGDNTNANASLTDFNNCYGPSWGRNKARTRPAVGNNDYKQTGAAGFFQYFGAAAGDSGKYYYSYNLGAWHIMVLNDQIAMTVGSPQELWLRAELAANTRKCTLAIWHRPRFSSTGTNNLAAVRPLWDALYAYNADVVVNANYFVYERFAPQSPTAVADPLGIREFIVGTGGVNLQNPGAPRPNSQVRNGTTYGVLLFTLDTASYSWQFVPVPGATFTDAGTTACHTRIPVVSVDVTPAPATVPVGGTVQLTATPKDAAGSPLTGRTVTWTSNNTNVATVDANGLVTGKVAGGPVTITATSEGKSGTATVAVVTPVASVSVSPATASVAVGMTVQLTATPKDAGGNPLTGRTVTWTPSDTTLATVDAAGLVTGRAAGGPVTVTATSEGKSGTAAISVTTVPVASIDVTPSSGSIQAGTTLQLTATLKDANGNPISGGSVTWSASDTTIATVDASGLVTGKAAGGPVTITAASEGKTGTAAVTVTPVPVASVVVAPATASVGVNGTVQLTATPKDVNGNTLTGRAITWATADPGIATVSTSGLVTGISAGGPIAITATSEGKSGSAAVTVTAFVAVASVDVTPATATIPVNGSTQLTATPRDGSGNALSGRTVTWSSNARSIAAVNGSGLVVGLAAGNATITATSEGVSGTAAITVQSSGPPVIAGAGDIADCSRVSQEATAKVLDNIAGTVVTFGDNAYEDGSLTNFMQCFDPYWGRHKWRTRPAPGNHEYNTSANRGVGYWQYFGAAAGDSGKLYYSYDLGAWHIIVINNYVDMSAGSAQEQWLRADLAAHPATCTLAYWHQPRFSSGGNGSDVTTQPIWQALYDYGADVVLNGHDHDYERFAPQTPTGAVDNVNGIKEFVVGTGGNSLYSWPGNPIANSELRSNVNYGVIKLTLWPTSYDWDFVPVAGGTFSDHGSASCHSGAPLPNQAPIAHPGGPYYTEGTVVLDGTQSRDPDNNTPLTYSWDLGDGTTANTATVTHTYPTEGSYVVTLQVTDAKGATSSLASTSVTVANVPPAVNAGADQSVLGGTALTVQTTFSDPGPTDYPWTYNITWGDGTSSGGSTNTQSNPITASHVYAASGRYDVSVSVTDKDGGTGSDDLVVKVLDPSTVQFFTGAGNIASCGTDVDEQTAEILDTIPGMVYALGDNVNPSGSATNYTSCYTPTWGRHKARTRAVVGNHEYDVVGANAFYTYFKPTVGDSAKYYYSFDLGQYWHVIVLNNTASVASGAGSVEEQWLKADLAANTKPCTIAMFHFPLYFSSDDPSWHSASGVIAIYNDLVNANAEIVLNGQSYFYERFTPQDAGGSPDAVRGVREFEVGTGGYATGYPLSIAPNSEVVSDAFGVLKLTLGPDSYIWDFIPAPGYTFTDHGSGNCH